jgi:hypothetical protein
MHRARSHDSVDVNRGRNVLQSDCRQLPDLDIHFVPNLIQDPPREADSPGRGQRFNRRGVVYSVTHDVIPLADDVSHVDSNP